MATIHARDIPDELYETLKERAAKAGRSVSAEVRFILEQTTQPKRPLRDVVRSVEETRARYSQKRFDVDKALRDERDR
jgi:plasmid stability protein